ncbi:MAG: hypothetical protein AAGM67_11600, partial [Bacteroidota bacterium]
VTVSGRVLLMNTEEMIARLRGTEFQVNDASVKLMLKSILKEDPNIFWDVVVPYVKEHGLLDVSYLEIWPGEEFLLDLPLSVTEHIMVDNAQINWKLEAFSRFKEIKLISISSSDLNELGLEEICRHGPFPNTMYLHFAGNYLGSAGLELLTDAKVFPNLRTLNLRSNHIQHNGMVMFLETHAYASLKRIYVGNNPCTHYVIQKWSGRKGPIVSW